MPRADLRAAAIAALPTKERRRLRSLEARLLRDGLRHGQCLLQNFGNGGHGWMPQSIGYAPTEYARLVEKYPALKPK